MGTKSYYAVIPANVRYDKGLANGAKLLYGEITALCNERGYCWANDSYFASLYEVSKRTIQNWMSDLEQKNYIERQIIYKKDSKEIEGRKIFIVAQSSEKNYTTPSEKATQPMEKNCTTPSEKNFRDNNTIYNNIYSRAEHDPAPSDPKKQNQRISTYKKIIEYLNNKLGTRYKYTTRATQRRIDARLAEGFTVADFQQVIDNKCQEWLDDVKMQKFLRPETLFGTKFDNYLNQSNGQNKQEAIQDDLPEPSLKEAMARMYAQ